MKGTGLWSWFSPPLESVFIFDFSTVVVLASQSERGCVSPLAVLWERSHRTGATLNIWWNSSVRPSGSGDCFWKV